MRKRVNGFTMIEIMAVTGIISVLAMLALPGLLRAKVNGNESFAQATLKTISSACESYAGMNFGQYPTAMADLVTAVPPYLNEDYTVVTLGGYDFACGTLDITGYLCTATPAACNQTGTKTFTITTGAVLASADC